MILSMRRAAALLFAKQMKLEWWSRIVYFISFFFLLVKGPKPRLGFYRVPYCDYIIPCSHVVARIIFNYLLWTLTTVRVYSDLS